MRQKYSDSKDKRKPKSRCDICGEVSAKLFCSQCTRRYDIRDKKCSQCKFYEKGICGITKEEVEKDYYCLFFYHGRKDV